MFLLCSHVDAEDLLHLGRERFFHIFLDSPQEEGLEDFVKTLITIFPSFPVFILKILPGMKPAVRNEDKKKRFSNLKLMAFSTFCAWHHIKCLTPDVLVRHEEVQQ